MSLRARNLMLSTVFDLMGRDENSATFAIGWAIEQCYEFRWMLLESVADVSISRGDEFTVDLQRHAEDGGYTDIEVRVPNKCHVIVEAKKGWSLPQRKQLNRYIDRFRDDVLETRRFVSISAASEEYARRNQEYDLAGIICTHRSWKDARLLVEEAQRLTKPASEKLWLRQLASHLREYEFMNRIHDNQVFVVSLGTQPIASGEPYNWIDVVTQDNSYFHPVGNRWPLDPPNYIAFRYFGQLQSVHHIDAYKVIADVSTINPKWPQTEIDHFVYSLGPAMRPPREVKSGPMWNNRVLCAIDTLLSGQYATVMDAMNETKRREASE